MKSTYKNNNHCNPLKMKHKTLLFIATILLASNATFGQMYLGQHLNDIKEEYKNGELEHDYQKHRYTYGVTNPDEGTYFLYFLNESLICYHTMLHPPDSESLQNWIEALNRKWVKIDNRHWQLYRTDNVIIEAECVKVEGVDGLCISFDIIENGEQQ